MAIKTSSQGFIPAVDLNFIQYNEFHMSVSEVSPHNIALTAKLKPYGVVDGVKYYGGNNKNMVIPNMDAYIATQVPKERQAEAMQAIAKVQQGLGVLASIYLKVDFLGVE